jgi:hypothetical protein
MGFTQFTNLIQKTLPINQFDIMRRKFQLIWVKKLYWKVHTNVF